MSELVNELRHITRIGSDREGWTYTVNLLDRAADALEAAERRAEEAEACLRFALPFAEDQADEEWFPMLERAQAVLKSPSRPSATEEER